ncbi:hypothetical protein QWY31_07635 [Cytophagales bacterium LB-30]|uniref:Addiction module protein n=1 Tax=Shiella aurantiaca TaxID=3058365 RepID=A0ABT8F4Q6_9BACT|nr:hypothetical protein [Shiella aurantiaca]MDN4165368.1 hypothetical protein [Shiella aurantiaca]
MISKEKLKQEIDKFPENEISIDELVDRLIFIEKLEARIKISEEKGETLSEEEVKAKIDSWSK